MCRECRQERVSACDESSEGSIHVCLYVCMYVCVWMYVWSVLSEGTIDLSHRAITVIVTITITISWHTISTIYLHHLPQVDLSSADIDTIFSAFDLDGYVCM